jgi:hypothetical protein
MTGLDARHAMRSTASVQVVSLALGLALTGVPGITAAVGVAEAEIA